MESLPYLRSDASGCLLGLGLNSVVPTLRREGHRGFSLRCDAQACDQCRASENDCSPVSCSVDGRWCAGEQHDAAGAGFKSVQTSITWF